MARIRTIKPQFWTDEKVGKLSLGARLLFIGTWNLADDEGLLVWNARYLKGQLFPYDEHVPVARYMKDLVDNGFIICYQSGDDVYAMCRSFVYHQTINRPQPSRLPLPSCKQIPEFKAKYTPQFTESSRSIHGVFTDDSVLEKEVEKEKEVEEEGTTTPPVIPQTSHNTFSPNTLPFEKNQGKTPVTDKPGETPSPPVAPAPSSSEEAIPTQNQGQTNSRKPPKQPVTGATPHNRARNPPNPTQDMGNGFDAPEITPEQELVSRVVSQLADAGIPPCNARDSDTVHEIVTQHGEHLDWIPRAIKSCREQWGRVLYPKNILTCLDRWAAAGGPNDALVRFPQDRGKGGKGNQRHRARDPAEYTHHPATVTTAEDLEELKRERERRNNPQIQTAE